LVRIGLLPIALVFGYKIYYVGDSLAIYIPYDAKIKGVGHNKIKEFAWIIV